MAAILPRVYAIYCPAVGCEIGGDEDVEGHCLSRTGVRRYTPGAIYLHIRMNCKWIPSATRNSCRRRFGPILVHDAVSNSVTDFTGVLVVQPTKGSLSRVYFGPANRVQSRASSQARSITKRTQCKDVSWIKLEFDFVCRGCITRENNMDVLLTSGSNYQNEARDFGNSNTNTRSSILWRDAAV